MKDPIDDLSDRTVFTLAADLRLQLEKGAGTRPMFWLIKRQREKARVAIHALVNATPTDIELIRESQNEIKLYDDMVTACRDLLTAGKDAETRLDDDDHGDITELMTPEQAHLHGLEQQGIDA